MSRALLAASLFLLPLVAGCFSNGLPITPLAAEIQTYGGSYHWPAPLVVDGSGAALARPDLVAKGAYPLAVESIVHGVGGEPNLGVTKKGTIVVTSLDQVMRSTDKGKTFQLAEDFVPPGYPTIPDFIQSGDPMLWLDTDTDRIFVPQMHPSPQCSWLQWSDGDGAPGTWKDRPLDCTAPLPYITFDHQKLMTAKPGPKTPPGFMPVGYPNVVYMCINRGFDVFLTSVVGTGCEMSYDGGLTFPVEREVGQVDQDCGNVNGHPAAWPDGTVAVVFGNLGVECKRPLTIAMTEDSGLTWSLKRCAPEAMQKEIDADITVTPDGTAYLLYRDGDELVHMLRSKDKFQTCDKFKIAPPGMTLSTFTAITSGDDGRIAMAYLGTMDPQPIGATPSNATGGSIWHAYVTTSTDAESASPAFVTQQVTPDEDPVQVGCVWLGGGGGGPFGCRNLLDFIDMVHDADGRWYVSITDGCMPRNGCTGTPNEPDFQSRDREIAVIVQDSGPSLFASKGTLAPIGLQWPDPQTRGDPPQPEPQPGPQRTWPAR